MECQRAREAISARLDGEDPGVTDRALDEHLRACGGCRNWQEAAHAVTRTSRLGPARAVTLTADDLVAAVLARSRPPRQPTSLTWARLGLVLVAIAQAAITVPLLLYGRDHAAPEHVAHETGAFAMALAVGFVVAAWKPDRARGMRTLVGAAAALLVITAALDLLHGRTDLSDEAPHLLAVVGWLLLVRVAVATPQPSADPLWSRRPTAGAAANDDAPVELVSSRPSRGPVEAGVEPQAAPERRVG